MVVKEKAGSERQRQGFGSTFTNSRTVFIGNPLSWVEIFYLGEWGGHKTKDRMARTRVPFLTSAPVRFRICLIYVLLYQR